MLSPKFSAPRPGGLFADPGAWTLAALAFLALGLRLWRAAHADWYWDEGYLAELALDLGRFHKAHSGALWFNGALPLTTSWIAPLSAAPFTWLLQKNALLAVRLWACSLGALSTLLLGLAGRRLGSWKLGLSAAALYALGPFPVAFGSLGLYHHLSCALGLAALWLALPPRPDEAKSPAWLPLLLAGLAAAACYWMWWLPLVLCLRPSPDHRPAAWIRRLALGLGPLALVLALSWCLGGPDARKMWESLASYNFMHNYVHYLGQFSDLRAMTWGQWFSPLWGEALECVRLFPVVFVGLAGLFLLGRGRAWIGLAAALGLAELFRQRGCMIACPYVLIPLLPWICLGLALGAARLGTAFPRSHWAAWAVGLALLIPSHLEWMSRLFVPPPMERNLQAFLKTQHCENDSVIAEPSIEWRLRQVCRPVEWSQAAAARGWGGGLLPAQLSSAAFAYDPSLDKARFLVTMPRVCDVDFGSLHQAVEALAAEYEGWPKVFANPWFLVYENPRFGVRRDPDTRIIGDPVYYRQAAQDARALGHADWAAFALARAATARQYKSD